MQDIPTVNTAAQHLRHLVIIRWLVLGCLCLSIVSGLWLLNILLAIGQLSLILLLFGLINVFTHLRLKQKLPVTDLEIFIQLLTDVVCLSGFFYFSGGANNPFVFYFLVPICISATTLSWSHSWIITLLCVCAYSVLLFFYVPLPALSPHHTHQSPIIGWTINLHILGMWVNFFISAVFITYFVVRMARDLKRRDDLLNQRREDELRDDQLMAVATLAAGTAHELGTPLSTMKIILHDLIASHQLPSTLNHDLQLLLLQVNQCGQTLRQLTAKAEDISQGQYPTESLMTFCQNILQRWQFMRPKISPNVFLPDNLPEIEIAFNPTVSQSIINLLNNAADACPTGVTIHIRWTSRELRWMIEDEGPGLSRDAIDKIGKAFVTKKGGGLGLGLFLTHASINRYGGKVHMYQRKPRGIVTELILPLRFEGNHGS